MPLSQIYDHLLRESSSSKIDIDRCLAIISHYIIEHQDLVCHFGKLSRKLEKFTAINRRCASIDTLEKFWYGSCTLEEKKHILPENLKLTRNLVKIKPFNTAEPTESNAAAIIQSTFQTWDKWDRLHNANKDKEYFWQWRITKEDYDALKDFLGSIIPYLNDEEILRHYHLHVSLFCAEWYKREYNGHGQGNYPAFSAIGYDNIKSSLLRDLCERAEITLRGNNRYMNSLYAQGGLPWRYIISNEDANLPSSIGKLFKAIKDDKFASIEQIAAAIHNSTIRESIIDKGSIHLNLMHIIEDETYEQYILDEFPNKSERERISSFIKGLKKEVIRYFSLIWRLDLRSDAMLVPMLSFSEKYAKAGIIPKELLDGLNIDTGICSKFKLSVKDAYNTECKSWTYFKCANGDYSTGELYDARVISRYGSSDQLPSKLSIYIEDIPGPFGIWYENGFGNIRSRSVESFDNIDVIKIYGEHADKVRYSNPKEKPLLILKREFITPAQEDSINELRFGGLCFYSIDKPLTLSVNGMSRHFAPYGNIDMTLDSRSLTNVLDTTDRCVRTGNSICTDVNFDGISEPSVLIVSHTDLEGMKPDLGDMPYDEKDCRTYYMDIWDNLIEDINTHYGFARLCIEYGQKKAERKLYVLDASRDIVSGIIRINDKEFTVSYSYQPENSREFNVGDKDSGQVRVKIFYPFNLSDTLLIYPLRKVWRSPRFLETYKDFYIDRTFGPDGCTESPKTLDDAEYMELYRPLITRDGWNCCRLGRTPKNDEVFYCYDYLSNRLYELEVTGNTLNLPRENIWSNCIVFQSLKNVGYCNVQTYRTNISSVVFNAEWWKIVFEHNLFIEDWLAVQSSRMPMALIGYYEYTSFSPDCIFLKNLAKSLKFNWLLMARWLDINDFRDDTPDKKTFESLQRKFDRVWPAHVKRLKHICEFPEDERVSDFIERYSRNIKKVMYVPGRGRETAAAKIAKVLAGITSYWSLDETDLKKMTEALSIAETYAKIEKHLKF